MGFAENVVRRSIVVSDMIVVIKALDHVLREINPLVLAYVSGSARMWEREVCRMKAVHHGHNL